MSRKIERIIVVLLGGCLLLAFGCQGERRSDDAWMGSRFFVGEE